MRNMISVDHYYYTSLKKNVYYSVYTKPTFPGGAGRYMFFLNKQFKFPATKKTLQEMQTSTLVDLIVDIVGSIIRPEIGQRKNKVILISEGTTALGF
jgi:hypothetical protein